MDCRCPHPAAHSSTVKRSRCGRFCSSLQMPMRIGKIGSRTLTQKNKKSVDRQYHDPDGDGKRREFTPRAAFLRGRLLGSQLQRLGWLSNGLGWLSNRLRYGRPASRSCRLHRAPCRLRMPRLRALLHRRWRGNRFKLAGQKIAARYQGYLPRPPPRSGPASGLLPEGRLGLLIVINGEVIRRPIEDITPFSHRNNLTLRFTWAFSNSALWQR